MIRRSNHKMYLCGVPAKHSHHCRQKTSRCHKTRPGLLDLSMQSRLQGPSTQRKKAEVYIIIFIIYHIDISWNCLHVTYIHLCAQSIPQQSGRIKLQGKGPSSSIVYFYISYIDKASKQFSNLLHLQLPNQHHSTSRNPARNVKNPFSITIFTMWEVFGVCLTIHLATKPPPTNHEMSPSLSRVKHVSLEDPCLSKYPKFPIHLHRCFRIQRPLLFHRTQKHAAVRSSPLKNITITQHKATMQMGHKQMHPPLLSFFFLQVSVRYSPVMVLIQSILAIIWSSAPELYLHSS